MLASPGGGGLREFEALFGAMGRDRCGCKWREDEGGYCDGQPAATATAHAWPMRERFVTVQRRT